MKKCPKCGMMNCDSLTLCEKCSAYIGDVEDSSTDVIEQIMRKEERSERLNRSFHILLAIIYYVVYIALFVVCLQKNTYTPILVMLLPAIFPLFYYLSVFKAETMFKLNHIFHIDNVDDIQLSDWYYISSKIGGYIILVTGIVLMVTLIPQEPSENDIVVRTSWSVLDNVTVVTDETTGHKLVVDNGRTEGIPWDTLLRENNAVFMNEDTAGAEGMLETIYQNFKKGSFTPPRILVDGDVVYEFIFDGNRLKMCDTKLTGNSLETTYHYNCKIEKNDKGYYISDFRTGLKLEFAF